jgi:pilus assembly protein TadC
MLKIMPYVEEMKVLIEEIALAKKNIKVVSGELESLNLRYQHRELDYSEYSKIKNKILGNRTTDHVAGSYKRYIRSLTEKLRHLNSKIVKDIYGDQSQEYLRLGAKKKSRPKKLLPDIDSLEIGRMELEIEEEATEPRKKEEETKQKQEEKKAQEVLPPEIMVPTPRGYEFQKAPRPRLSFFKRLVYAMQFKEKPWLAAKEVGKAWFGGFFSKEFIDYLITGKQKQDVKSIFGKTSVLPSILTFEDQEKVNQEIGLTKSDVLDPYLLEKQIKEIKSIISKKKPDVYKASTLGYVANLTVRKLSIYFIERYPGFFKRLYTAVRYANLKVLANTYINIMFFLTIVISLFSVPLLTVFFAFQGEPIGMAVLKIIGSSLSIGASVFGLCYYYPFMAAKSRKRSINTNLPFAIDHMASVIASGVNPATMFKLISNSSEYGEISVEIEKVTSYIEFFGYDILTALKAVSLTTPSEEFKEFLDGFVSTIETGGDLKEYLSQKSQEALLNYRLERQKYVESLSTYSDIYTGVLIAAPLFFVTALSLVSVLGGTIGGMSVNSLITIGTYLVIPGMNILFLVFLEFNQPEV